MNLRAVDACQNPSVLPAPVSIENLETGCDVVLSGLPENNLFTSNDGTVDANGLQTSISANIDTTLAGCVGATATLSVEGTEVANEAVPADGVVTFPLSLVRAVPELKLGSHPRQWSLLRLVSLSMCWWT